MSGRYLLADYKDEKDKTPRVALRTDDLEEAKKTFKKSAHRKIKSAVLFDTARNEVLLVSIEGEPIHFVNAIELARTYVNHENAINFIEEAAALATASDVVNNITRAFEGRKAIFTNGHYLGPYYLLESKNVVVSAGVLGGLSGAFWGAVIAGPVGFVVGGVTGAYAGNEVGKFIKAFIHPHVCRNCRGRGLVDNYRRCPACDGYGYNRR